MQGTFHWLRMRVFCYATEDEELVGGALAELAGVDEVERDEADSEHGNRILIFSCELLKQADVVPVFQRLGRELCEGLAGSLGDRVDEDCVLHLRLDKQELVQGRYVPARHGDVLSVTGKVASHPARKEVAVRNMGGFLSSLAFPEGEGPS